MGEVKKDPDTISNIEAMSCNRHERRRLGKLNGKKFPGTTFPIIKPKQD